MSTEADTPNDLSPVEWLERVLAWLNREIAEPRENPPMIDFFDDEDTKPRVLMLIVNARNTEVIRANLVKLTTLILAVKPLADWFDDEITEAREHQDPDHPTTLRLMVKTRQVERFREALADLASRLRKAQP
jgi:hypothetical protein